jgi:hypothetical protein
MNMQDIAYSFDLPEGYTFDLIVTHASGISALPFMPMRSQRIQIPTKKQPLFFN